SASGADYRGRDQQGGDHRSPGGTGDRARAVRSDRALPSPGATAGTDRRRGGRRLRSGVGSAVDRIGGSGADDDAPAARASRPAATQTVASYRGVRTLVAALARENQQRPLGWRLLLCLTRVVHSGGTH